MPTPVLWPRGAAMTCRRVEAVAVTLAGYLASASFTKPSGQQGHSPTDRAPRTDAMQSPRQKAHEAVTPVHSSPEQISSCRIFTHSAKISLPQRSLTLISNSNPLQTEWLHTF